jgi:hypothetical protein
MGPADHPPSVITKSATLTNHTPCSHTGVPLNLSGQPLYKGAAPVNYLQELLGSKVCGEHLRPEALWGCWLVAL